MVSGWFPLPLCSVGIDHKTVYRGNCKTHKVCHPSEGGGSKLQIIFDSRLRRNDKSGLLQVDLKRKIIDTDLTLSPNGASRKDKTV